MTGTPCCLALADHRGRRAVEVDDQQHVDALVEHLVGDRRELGLVAVGVLDVGLDPGGLERCPSNGRSLFSQRAEERCRAGSRRPWPSRPGPRIRWTGGPARGRGGRGVATARREGEHRHRQSGGGDEGTLTHVTRSFRGGKCMGTAVGAQTRSGAHECCLPQLIHAHVASATPTQQEFVVAGNNFVTRGSREGRGRRSEPGPQAYAPQGLGDQPYGPRGRPRAAPARAAARRWPRSAPPGSTSSRRSARAVAMAAVDAAQRRVDLTHGDVGQDDRVPLQHVVRPQVRRAQVEQPAGRAPLPAGGVRRRYLGRPSWRDREPASGFVRRSGGRVGRGAGPA